MSFSLTSSLTFTALDLAVVFAASFTVSFFFSGLVFVSVFGAYAGFLAGCGAFVGYGAFTGFAAGAGLGTGAVFGFALAYGVASFALTSFFAATGLTDGFGAFAMAFAGTFLPLLATVNFFFYTELVVGAYFFSSYGLVGEVLPLAPFSLVVFYDAV